MWVRLCGRCSQDTLTVKTGYGDDEGGVYKRSGSTIGLSRIGHVEEGEKIVECLQQAC